MVSETRTTEWATIGEVVAIFGVRGEIKVRLLTDIPDRFRQLKAVYIGPDHHRATIEHVRPYKGEMVVLKLAGIDDANAAETLRHLPLCIPASQLARLPPDHYYQHDILGLQVVTGDGQTLGPVVDIIETGSNDVYVIKTATGKQVLVPAIKAVVKQIDLAHRTMLIDPLPGLLEPPTPDEREEQQTDEITEREEDFLADDRGEERRE